MQVLILHLQAPLMSFGGPQVDQIGPTGRFPTVSQMTGLLANALGYTHGDADRTQALQDRLALASALVREGEELLDYQTVDLGQPHLRNPAWTTHGSTEHRYGGLAAKYGTHIRYRHFRVDASVLSAVALLPVDEAPTLSAVSEALIRPARPLVIGRKPCLPSTRLVVGLVEDSDSLTDALEQVPSTFSGRWCEIAGSLSEGAEVTAEWPVDDQFVTSPGARVTTHRVIDRRDWRNQLHGGERVVARGPLTMSTVGDQGIGDAL